MVDGEIFHVFRWTGKMQMQSSKVCSRQYAPFRFWSVKQRVSGASMRRLCYLQ